MSTQSQGLLLTEGYTHISDVVDKTTTMMDLVREGKVQPYFTGSQKETDKIGGYFPSDQLVIAARLGVGKTAKALKDIMDFCNPVINPYYVGKLVILYDSYEMSDWRGVLRMISGRAGIESKALLDYHQKLSQERFDALKVIARDLKGIPVYFSNRPKTTAAWLEAKKQVQKKFPNHYIITLFDHTRLIAKGEESKEEEKLANLMMAGMELKNNFNHFNIFLSQMNRSIETSVNRSLLGTNTPVMSDLFGSDSIGQCADIVIALHRPGMYGLEFFEEVPTGINHTNPDLPDNLLVECILKQREGWTGKLLMKHNLAINHVEDYNLDKKVSTLNYYGF